MTPQAETPDPDAPDQSRVLTPEEREARRRRLAEVFGEVIPEQTSDDADEPQAPDGTDDWLRRQVPPHHG
jgi:hypothetical protein